MLTRREFVKSCAIASAATTVGSSLLNARGEESLKSVAAKASLLYGSPLFPQDFNKPRLLDLYEEQTSIITATVYMKKTQPSQGHFELSNPDWVRDFAHSKKIQLRGHALIFGNATPDWVGGEVTKDQAEKILVEHVRTLVKRYAGQMHSWDVVNEAIDPTSDRSDAFRRTPWVELLDSAYIELAFRTAAEADPKAILTYNDFGVEGDAPDNDVKRRAILKMLESLKKKDVPIGAFGIQSHIGAQWHGTKLRGFLHEVEQLGLKIFVTELDVRDKDLPADISARDRGVAEAYSRYLDVMLENRAVEAVLTWGLYDGDSWLKERQSRSDGRPLRPLPFDEDLHPKPAVEAMIHAFGNRRG
jgi:endo-1,4-beta-xylanase